MGNWEIDALMPALKERDAAALEQLYDLCSGRAFSLAYRILGDHGTAEDAVQDAFIDLWQHTDRLSPERGSLLSLLLTMVHHKSIDRLRKTRGQTRLHFEIDITLIQEIDSEARDVAEVAMDRTEVAKAMAMLPDEQSRCVELAYFNGYTQVEIASIMNVPLGTVKSRLRLALERLRLILKEGEVGDLSRGR
ncbi:MAG TPA: sigma-70 family RNA polymerase sigma factor [Dehalococcoidia bacterium]|nr:sigma-70 family RNA polymerase sigma factor [Dehalococcoidia bacterium]